MAVVKIMAHGQITIPKKIRDTLGIEKGDLAEAEILGDQVVITPKKLVKQKALVEMEALLKTVHSRNKGVTEEQVTADVLQAIAEYRQEKHANPQKNSSSS
jgi:AbrB family looped-hinge helix DNA binding protein